MSRHWPQWRETRKMMGQESTESVEFTAFDPPRSYTAGCESCGAYMETTFRFTPAGGTTAAGTDVTVDVRCEARSAFAKWISPPMGLLFGKMMRGCIGGDPDDIARAAESLASTAQ